MMMSTLSLRPPRRPRHSRAWSAAAVALPVLAVGLAGCAQSVPFDLAPDGTAVECADIVVRLPDVVADEPERETNAQGTGAWGDPASVLLRCGVEVPGPTTEQCVSVNDVDWIVDDSRAPLYTFTTYGRDPATEVVVDSDVVSGTTALTDLASAVGSVPAVGGCVGAEDLDVPAS